MLNHINPPCPEFEQTNTELVRMVSTDYKYVKNVLSDVNYIKIRGERGNYIIADDYCPIPPSGFSTTLYLELRYRCTRCREMLKEHEKKDMICTRCTQNPFGLQFKCGCCTTIRIKPSG